MGREWSGRQGLADVSFYIQNGQTTRSYSMENNMQYPVINHHEKEYEKEYISYVHNYIYN